MRLPRSPALWTLVAVGLAARLSLAFATYGYPFDIDSFAIVREALGADPLHVYSLTAERYGETEILRWPYPPGFFAWIGVSAGMADAFGVPFHGVIQLPAILADAAIAVLVYVYLGWHLATERTRLLAAGLVVLGPAFVAVSGYHGQIDSVAILPAVAALMAWERLDDRRRAWIAGALVGLGAAIKTVPLLVLLALLPSARSFREGGIAIAAAAAIPVALLIPFLLADPAGVDNLAGYSGAPGVGGLSLAIQPGLATAWLTGAPIELNEASRFLYEHGGTMTLGILVLFAAFLLRQRPAPIDTSVLLWLTIYALSPNFFLHYAIWGLPFFLMAGYVKAVAGAQLLLLTPILLTYLGPWEDKGVAYAYAPLVITFWLLCVAGMIAMGARIAGARERHPPGVQPPRGGPGWGSERPTTASG